MHYYHSMNKYIHIYILIILIYLTRGNGNFLNARSRDYGLQRNADSSKLVKGEEDGASSNVNTGLVEDGGGVRAVGEVFVPKTFPMSSQEPSCEQLRAMWIFSKRQSRGAEITNEIPTYRDPFTYNVWEPLYSNSRLLGSLRMGARERARSPVFGRVVSREPIIPQRVNFEQRQRHLDGSQSRLYGAEVRPISAGSVPAPAPSSPRRSSKNRHMGVPNSSSGNQNSVAVQGSFQKLKELIWTERAKELTQQRRAEELAARAAVLKEIANGQNIQSSYKLPFNNNQGDSILMDENRSPDSSGNQYLIHDRMSIANIQNFDANNKNAGHRNNGARASTRRIGSAYGSATNGNNPARKDSYFSGNSPASGQPKTVTRLRIPLTEINPAAELPEKDQTVIGIPRTYPIRQSHFRERNRSLLKQYPPNEYFERNTRILKSLQFGPETSVRGDSNDNYLSPYTSIEEYGPKPGNVKMDDCNKSESDSEEFFDARSDQLDMTPFEMDLKTSLEEAKLAIDYFFDNKFEEARTLLKPFAGSSLYHSMGTATFSFLEAMLTFEHIDEASAELKKCVELCQRFRKKNTLTESIGNTFKKKNFNTLTDLECHAELCMAEVLLMSALLTFIEDENLSGLIRGSLQVRQCYNCFRFCGQILKHRMWDSSSMSVRNHFSSGVHLGIGTFNLMMSMLPVRIVKILQFIGFSSKRNDGLQDLRRGYQENGLRQILCALSLLGYHLMVLPMVSERHSHEDLSICDEILTSQLAKYPNSVWMLFFKGRFELVNGNLAGAESWYLRSWKSQNVWPQFHYLSFWELLWINCIQQNWDKAQFYANQLLEQSNWSRAIYAYQLAAIKLMSSPGSADNLQKIDQLMTEVPTCRQKIAGKSLPMEKFMAKRAIRYKSQNERLVLPLIELMYLWNMFKFIGKDYQIADGILQIIDSEFAMLNNPGVSPATNLYNADNRALCLLLRGSCYAQMGKPALALQDFYECIAQSGIVEDHFIIPYAYVEAALCHASENQSLAISMLQDTKKKFSKFALESRLHFRIHMALMDLNGNLDTHK
ncbi:tetratricopeptide repeat protein 39B isoform X3 [Drosophila montana]|uniref:tetratricopeptide repeat protein 39B isoform X3 n=1 Tax=Drosophila montana TaxID=40370 RepID=UPI00313D76DC